MKRTIPKKKYPHVKLQQKTEVNKQPYNKWNLLIVAGLLILIIIVYFPTLTKVFISYDDMLYIINCPDIRYFTFDRIPEIFSHFYSAQYSPFTTVFLGIIHLLSGENPLLYNITGILLHLVCTLLVFALIRSLSGKFSIAVITAALFSLSPMQVESVAWSAAVFKTCLYSIFYLSSLILYINYVKKNKLHYFIISLLLFLLSFFSKEQSVALSLSVIAIDYFMGRNLISKKVILEKIPYLLVSVIIGLTALASTKSYHEAVNVTPFSFSDKFLYASYSLANYIIKLLVPFRLSIYHPYITIKSILFYIYPFLIIVTLWLFFYFLKKNNKYIIFGMLFFFINISFSLILQFLAARSTVMADRYVYISSIGYYFIIGSLVTTIIEKKLMPVTLLTAVLILYISFISYYSYNRTFVWKNTETVMTDVIEKYPRTSFPYVNRGVYLRQHGQEEKALQDYNMAISIGSKDADAYMNRGNIYFNRNNDSLALSDYNEALSINPNPKSAEIFSNRGSVYARMKLYDKALSDFSKALSINPYFLNVYLNRALTYMNMKNFDSAINDFNSYMKLNPGDFGVYSDLGVLKQNMNRHEDAIKDFNYAIKMNPNNPNYYYNRSISYYWLSDFDNAVSDIEKAIKLGYKVDPVYLKRLKAGK
jgi:tetratricopeptide (TPR) repeat protein